MAADCQRDREEKKQVMSVSPTRSEPGRSTPQPDRPRATRSKLDPAAFDEVATTLRDLIDAADRSERGLRSVLHETGEVDARAGQASVLLQERLRLGARMVKAFQTQIARVEEALQGVDERQAMADQMLAQVDERIRGFEQRAENVMVELQQRLDRMVQEAVDRFEEQVQGAAEEMRDVEARLAEVHESSSDLQSDVESARAELQRTSSESQQTITAARLAASELTGASDRAETIEGRLGAAVSEAEARLEQALAEARRISAGVETNLDLARTAGARLERAADRADVAGAEVETITRAAQRIENALEALAPWQGLLAEASDELSLQRGANELAETFARRVGEPMASLAATLREVAERLQQSVPGEARPADDLPQIKIVGSRRRPDRASTRVEKAAAG